VQDTFSFGGERNVGASTIASFVALSLPWFLNRLGIDRAFGAGPLATVIQDLLSVVIYLVIATAMLR
jgi:magnesium transporter